MMMCFYTSIGANVIRQPLSTGNGVLFTQKTVIGYGVHLRCNEP